MNIRKAILRSLSRLFTVNVTGDADIPETTDKTLSCIINFYGRTELLRNILAGLGQQDISRDDFEVILVEDRNGTEEGRFIAEEFSRLLNIRYLPLVKNFGIMGYSRNTGIENSTGEYILFLDDDTVILQNDFLSGLIKEFGNGNPDAILPRGNPSYCLTWNKYQYHEPYFPTNRCVAYTRDTLRALRGFVSDIVGQEDVEFTVRLLLSDRKLAESSNLEYFHPPLIVENSSKSVAVGYSFGLLRGRYPFVLWLMLIVNGCRYLPLFLLPFSEKYRHQARFSAGFFKGFVYSFLGRDVSYG